LRRVLLRGLEVAPQWRFTSMDELIAALENDPGVRRRRVALGLAGALAIGVLALAARGAGGHKAPLCRDGAQHWEGVWSSSGAASSQRDSIRRAFVATGKGYAERAFSAASEFLDGYFTRWLGAYREACEATAVRGEQSAEVLDLRMTCLNERVVRARAVIDTFARADAKVVENALEVVNGLPRLERCADVPILRAAIKPPEDEAVRKSVDDLRGELARLVAERDAGHLEAAERIAQTLLPRIRATKYRPLLAEALNAAARINLSGGGNALSLLRYREAYVAALASGNDEAAIVAALYIAECLADPGGRPAEARPWLDVARALLDRIGGNALLEAWVLLSEGVILETEGRPGDAVIVLKKSRDVKIRLLGDKSTDVYESSLTLSNALLLAGQYEEARAECAAAVAALTALVGADHPMVGITLDNEGEALNGLGRFAEARDVFQRSLAILRAAGAAPRDLAIVLTGLGRADVGVNQFAEATAVLEEALRSRIEAGDSPEHLGETRFALARALWPRAADRPRSRALAKQAREDYGKVPSSASRIEQIDRWLAAPEIR
jgi:tetratricopeptide (TPR) repeat protein